VERKAWVVNKAGTRYVRTPPEPKPEKVKDPEAGTQLVALLQGEAEGDIDLAIVLAVRNLLKNAKNWNPRCRATGIEGPTDPVSHTARAWSLFGAIECVVTPGFEKRKRDVLRLIKAAVPKDDTDSHSLMHWEPRTTHSKLLWVLNMAVSAKKKSLGYKEG
jgi:hypothetical protein